MKKYFLYIKSLLRHKWFVFLEACKLGIPFLGIVHDISKFFPGEFIPYARYDFSKFGKNSLKIQLAFDKAWLKHQKRNKHHWQYWLLMNDNGQTLYKKSNNKDIPSIWMKEVKPLRIPKKYVLEMMADWRGAGKAYGSPDTKNWFINNKDKIIFEQNTEVDVWTLLYKETKNK